MAAVGPSGSAQTILVKISNATAAARGGIACEGTGVKNAWVCLALSFRITFINLVTECVFLAWRNMCRWSSTQAAVSSSFGSRPIGVLAKHRGHMRCQSDSSSATADGSLRQQGDNISREPIGFGVGKAKQTEERSPSTFFIIACFNPQKTNVYFVYVTLFLHGGGSRQVPLISDETSLTVGQKGSFPFPPSRGSLRAVSRFPQRGRCSPLSSSPDH